MKYAEFLATTVTRTKPDNQRVGQWLFNKLSAVRPDIVEKITGTDADPFYQDENIARFWEAVQKHWRTGSLHEEIVHGLQQIDADIASWRLVIGGSGLIPDRKLPRGGPVDTFAQWIEHRLNQAQADVRSVWEQIEGLPQ